MFAPIIGLARRAIASILANEASIGNQLTRWLCDERRRCVTFDAMRRKSFEHMNCPIAQSLELVGEWWTPLILRDIVLFGYTRFDVIQRNLGIAPTVLTSRLNSLVGAGLLERHQYNDHPPRFEYLPTEAAKDFETVLEALNAWGRRWTTLPAADQAPLRTAQQ